MAKGKSAVVEKEEVEGEAAAPEEKVPEVAMPEFKTRDVAPKSVKAVLVELDEVKGWDGGDPPASDFIADIRRFGIEQPIRIRENGDGGYVVVEGRRRLKTAKILVDEGLEAFRKIAAFIDTRKGREPGLASLAMNYQRGDNYIGDAYTVKSYLEKGWTDKQIAAASGLKLDQVRALRDVATKLDSRLIAAVERGQMLPWAAKMAARQPFPVQDRLVKRLEENGKVTADDVIEERNAGKSKALGDLPDDFFEGEGLEYDGEGDDTTGGGLPSAGKASKPKTGKVTREQRLLNVKHYIISAKAEINAIKGKARTSDEQEILQFCEEILARVDGSVAEPVLAIGENADPDATEDDEGPGEPDPEVVEAQESEDTAEDDGVPTDFEENPYELDPEAANREDEEVPTF